MRVICDGFWHTVFGASGAGWADRVNYKL
jgi:hypothetical protein